MAQRRHLSTVTRVVMFTAVYFLGGLLGESSYFYIQYKPIALLWWPSGIAIAAIVLFGYRFWWGVTLGAVLFTITQAHGEPFGFFTFGAAVGNTIGAILCAYLLERFVKFKPNMERVKDVVGFIVFASFLGTIVIALFNVVGLWYAHQLRFEEMFPNTLNWWVPNMMGVLVVTPLALSWIRPTAVEWCARLYVEAAIWLAVLVGSIEISFNSFLVHTLDSYPLAFLPWPFLIWGSLRFGQRGATTGTLLVAAQSIYELIQGRGPFVVPGGGSGAEKTSLVLLGCYIAVTAITNLLLAGSAVERATAIRATEESERRYRGVVEDQSDLICRFTPNGTITFVNQAYCRFHKKTKEELIGSNFFPDLPPEDRDIPLSVFSQLTPEMPYLSFDERVMMTTGQLIWQQCTVRALFDEESRLTEMQAVIQSMEAARVGAERLQTILNSIADGVIVLDHHGVVTLFNPAAEKVFERSAADVVGKPLRELFAANDHRQFEDYLNSAHGESTPKIVEFTALRPNGSLPVDFAMSKISRGTIRLFVAVVRDISERKSLEDQFRQAQKMEAIGRLAGGIAHDFNNLMQAVLGYSNLLEKRLAQDDPNREAVEQIHRSVDRARSLTRQLLAFSRKQVLTPKLLALNTVVTDMTKLLQRLIGESIRLEIDLASPSPFVRADPGQMEQMILNLAINGRDAMPNGGALRVQTASIQVTAEHQPLASLPPGPYAVLTVSDTGHGMSAHVKEHLFEPFFTTKEMGKGTGLGLSIIYGIVKQSNGEISVASEEGQGASFTIYLPRFQGENAQEEPAAIGPATVSGNETILLAEDEELVRMMLVEVLKSEGYKVLEAKHGVEAIALAANYDGRIDMLVTDMSMPEFSGWELSSRLAESRKEMLVMFMSGYTDEEIARQGKLTENARFLQKPFQTSAFLAKVREILDRK